MNRPASRLTLPRILLAILSILLAILSWERVLSAGEGLVTRRTTVEGIPMIFMAPANQTEIPGILIAHGFGGSRQLMLGYGNVLAHAGYGVLLWDFDGHGVNNAPFNRNDRSNLRQNLDIARAVLIRQPEIDPANIGTLGHSMGSGVVLQAGVAEPRQFAATVAVSPVDAEITAVAPRNLLLQAGEFEPRFAERAQTLLELGGGENSDFATGAARLFVEIPRVEHITILFSPVSHAASQQWFDRTFGVQQESSYQDLRMLWYIVHLGAWLVGLTAVSPILPNTTQTTAKTRRFPLHWVGLLLAPLLATGIMFLLQQFISTNRLAGIWYGGALGLWFFIFGAIWLLVGFRPPRISLISLIWGIVLFAILWFAFGALANFVWLPWLLTPLRLYRWPFLAATCFPWLLAAGTVQEGNRFGKRLAWWFWQSLFISAGLILQTILLPSLSVLILVLPLLPILFGLLTIVGAAIDKPWAYALGSSLFFGWLLLAYFPLSG